MTTDPTTGIDNGYTVKRRTALTGISPLNCRAIIQALEKMPGVARASIDERTSRLTLSYDSSKRNISEIETVLQAYDGGFAEDWWTRFKIGWYRNLDTNARDNAHAEVHCCNKPPK